jgi:prepilin-type N-terminal cleavage/methylation domain-containing protein
MKREDGFSLVELAVVLVVIGVVASYAMAGSQAYVAAQHVRQSRERVASASHALVLFVARNKRLPCPADGTLPDANASAGHEAATGGNTTTCSTSAAARVLPWRDLGLEESASLDGWGHRIGYYVMSGAQGLTQTGGMDMSGTRAAATDSTAPSAWLLNRGLLVKDQNGIVLLDPADPTKGGGAAFVLISYGSDGAGSYLSSGNAMPPPASGETLRAADTAASLSSFVTAPYADGAPGSAQFFNFILATPSVHAIAAEAGLGPQ